MIILTTRLKKYQQKQEYQTREIGLNRGSVSLYEDFAANINGDLVIGSVTRLLCRGTRSRLEYRRPVEFSSPKGDKITVTLQVYDTDGGLLYNPNNTRIVSVPFKCILCPVNLSIREDGQLQLSAEDSAILADFFRPKANSAPRRRGKSSAHINSSVDGTQRLVVDPGDQGSPENIRHSRHKRTMILYND